MTATGLSVGTDDANDLLQWFAASGFTCHIAGDAGQPHVLVFSLVLGDYVDLAHVRGQDRAEVARIPLDEHVDIWCPRAVCWHYYGSVTHAVCALQRMQARMGGRGPSGTYLPPRDGHPRPLTVTSVERRTVTVRLAGGDSENQARASA